MRSAMRQRLLEQRSQLQGVSAELLALSPALSVQRSIARLAQLRVRISTSARDKLSNTSHKIALLARALNSVSPLATLDRGYAIVKHETSGKVLLNAASIAPGENIRARLSRGEIVATVKKVITND